MIVFLLRDESGGDGCLLERESAMSDSGALQETIDGSRARGIAVLIKCHLNLLLKGPFNWLSRGSRPAVLQSDDRHMRANGIALPNEESEGTPHALRHVWGSTCAHTFRYKHVVRYQRGPSKGERWLLRIRPRGHARERVGCRRRLARTALAQAVDGLAVNSSGTPPLSHTNFELRRDLTL